MRRLLQFVALFAVTSLCICYDSHESSESVEDLFVPPNQANSFIAPQRRTPYNPRNNRRRPKSPGEKLAEICEDYNPCRFYASHFGSQQAYQRFFRFRSQPQPRPNPIFYRRY